jgi:mRNA interferase MazF
MGSNRDRGLAKPVNLRGTIVKVRLSPSEGREQAGIRPAMVVSPTFFNERSELLVVLPITSQKVDRIYPFEVLIDHEACGLDHASKAMANQARTVDKKRVVGTYGIADKETMDKVNDVLKLTLGLVEF